MKDNAALYGIDPERIVLGGHSAGGFLSLATGMFDATDVSTFLIWISMYLSLTGCSSRRSWQSWN